ncbi:Ferric-uptake regulator [Syntrophomonas zehnderi OL-4]|uniref:Ferric-uptake regulator n=2 Tax=Syntrophomonas TaxID=862 RepID=A0A0E4C7J9_9FIRM|nr:Ferric-uptake regulator [Syntrophomonas zehnderi OL-4]
MDMKEIAMLLKDHGIKPSHHRMKIYEYLVTHRNHPNVDMVYQELIQEIPTLSKTTLYNTLNLFLNKGLVQLITIAENEMHYDADVSMHGHFMCKECKKIYDIWFEDNDIVLPDLKDFAVDESHIYFRGTCLACLNKQLQD